MNVFRADRFWRLPQFVHELVYHLTGFVVVRTGREAIDDVSDETATFKWADYEREVFWPAQERFIAALRRKESA